MKLTDQYLHAIAESAAAEIFRMLSSYEVPKLCLQRLAENIDEQLADLLRDSLMGGAPDGEPCFHDVPDGDYDPIEFGGAVRAIPISRLAEAAIAGQTLEVIQ